MFVYELSSCGFESRCSHGTSNSVTTNGCRRDLFCKGRLIDNIPPTSAALIKHALRSAYIAGHVWGQSTIPRQDLLSPIEWGWKEKDGNISLTGLIFQMLL